MSELPQTSDSFTPALHLIYANPELTTPVQSKLASRLKEFAALAGSDPSINWQINNSDKCLGDLRFDEHHVQIAGLANALPQSVIDRTINVSLWQAQIKAGMRQHQAHLSLIYRGNNPNPVEKMLALYRAAYSFNNENLLGVVNEPAWTAHPTADFLSIEKIEQYREEIPFILWFGYVRIFVDKQRYWLVTKGHHLFDVPDLAYFIESAGEEETVINHFINLFYYLYDHDVFVTAGDTLEIGKSGEIMRFSEVTEYAETMLGPAGTLVVEKVKTDATGDQDSSS